MDGFRKIAAGLYLEGLAADPADGAVWYSDVIAGGIHRIGAEGGAQSFGRQRMWTGGIALNQDGKVLSSGAEGIQWTDPASGQTGWLMDRFGVNEMAPDGAGGLYFGSIDLASIIKGQPAAPARIHHLAADGTQRALTGELGFVNGMALSDDGRTLFYNESFRAVFAFDVGADGSLANQRKLLDKPDCDGMALDAEGTLWVTGFSSSHIERLRGDGTRLDPVQTPAEAITQLRFGGNSGGHDFWIAAVALDAGAKLKVGRLPTEENSFIWQGRSAVRGLPQRKAGFTL